MPHETRKGKLDESQASNVITIYNSWISTEQFFQIIIKGLEVKRYKC